jgi:glycosyltransferase involved in cell wall biosynthesis
LTPKRIICTVTNDLTYDRRMDRICNALADAGYDVVLVGRKLKDSLPLREGKYKGVRLRCFFNTGFLFYKEFNLRLFFYLLFTRFDIACACDLDTALPVLSAAKLKGKKSVYDAHEFYTESPELVGRPGVKNVWEWIGRLTVPHFDAHYTVGERIATLLREKYDVNFNIIRNIAPASSAPEQIKPIIERDDILLYQGAINIGRGLETLIEAMVELPGWQLWLAGEGDITAKLKSKAELLNVTDRVSFLGWVKPINLPMLMQQAKISVNLRDKASMNDYLSLPNKFFDAIHAGLPSINMDFPEYRAICDKYPVSFLIGTLSVDAICNVIRLVEIDPMLLIKMSEACIDAAREYTWANEGKRLIEIYQGLHK